MKAGDTLFSRIFSLLIPALCIFLGIAIQIQASFGVTPNYSGIRINLADILLPLIGLMVLGSIVLKKTAWPRWAISGGILWPALLTAIMTFALINGYMASGMFSQWALVNKFIGWLILACYFGLGGWLTTNYGDPAIRLFLQSFVTAFLIISVAGIIHLSFQDIFSTRLITVEERQLKGLMGNRNAFAFLALMIMSLLAVYSAAGVSLLPKFTSTLFWVGLPFLLAYDGSRAACGAALVILIVIAFFFKRRAIKPIFLPLLIGISIISALYTFNPGLVLRERQGHSMTQFVGTAIQDQGEAEGSRTSAQKTDSRKMNNRGDIARLRVFGDAVALWKESPAIGIGLGVFLKTQSEKYGSEKNFLDIIDTTPLWLLVETGILGLSAFVLFSLFALYTLWRGIRSLGADIGKLRLAMIFAFIGFALMSLFHELLYSRHLWLMLGMALAGSREKAASVRIDQFGLLRIVFRRS